MKSFLQAVISDYLYHEILVVFILMSYYKPNIYDQSPLFYTIRLLLLLNN